MTKEFKKLLKEFVAIPSVSTDPIYKDSIKKASKWLASYCSKSGMKAKIITGYDNPIIIAKTPYKVGKETVLIYGHYDVQPAQKEDGWKTDPFILTEKQGRLYGRGATDNKGQILTHLYSIAGLIKENRLSYNVTFFIEGNEETGSPNLSKFIRKYKKELECDCVMISDGALAPENLPALECSFRGVANMEVILETALDDVHSGLFGGVTPNAAEELAKIVGSLTDLVGKKNGFKVKTTRYDKRVGLDRTVEVTGFSSGYTGTGFRNSIPCKAVAKLNLRSKPNEDPNDFVKEVKKYILKQTPRYARVRFKVGESASGIMLNLSDKFNQKTRKILESVYKQKVVNVNCGAILPIVRDFDTLLKVPQVMVPLANEDCGMHSASENISIEALKKGLEFSQKFFSV